MAVKTSTREMRFNCF